jgi:hypothetical protein
MNQGAASTQHYLNVSDIRDNMLILKNGELRQILEVTALNFALKSEQEQATIIYQYQAFLNSLQFPIQILVQSRRLDLTNYLTGLQQRMEQTTSPLFKAQIADYLDFINRLINLGNIMEKHFYVIVPLANAAIRSRGLVNQLFRRDVTKLSDKDFAEAQNRLSERVEAIRSGLSGIGLSVTVLEKDAIAKLLYTTYNPIESDEVALQPPSA